LHGRFDLRRSEVSMMRPFRTLAVSSLLLMAGQTSAPTRPAGVDEALWRRMVEVNRKSEGVTDLVADFEQQKFTAMLRKPLVSSGRVKVRGPVMRWETAKPEPTVLRIGPGEVRMYYPREKTVEVYAVEEKLGSLAASPLPRLDVLVRHFAFAPLDVKEMGEADDQKHLAVRMTPADPDLGKHVDEVRVLIDAGSGYLNRMEMTDADGDRTVISFTNVRTNVGLGERDVALDVPAGVKVTRPLAGLERGAESGRGK
jgi:outer membrane lipoprotein-sorting protein